jgi:signal transduction histidine kinase
VEELAAQQPGDGRLVETARHQIRRIDRWLRSFLALSAGGEAASELADLEALTREVALEAIQEGAAIRLSAADERLPVEAVPAALRSALANLIVNAAEASPGGSSVEVRVFSDGSDGVVTVEDRGPGLPEDVRRKLYAPHVTTKIGGSGMGLFLARQMIVGMHGGSLAVTDREGGGTRAEVRVPLSEGDRDGPADG